MNISISGLNLRDELDVCFKSFNPKTTHRIDFANKVLQVLVNHTHEKKLDTIIVYESVAGSSKNSLSFIQSLIGGLAMTDRQELALSVAEKVAEFFPELLSRKVSYSKALN